MGDEGIDPLLLVRVDEQAGALVHQQQVLILVDNIQLRLEDGEKRILRGGGVEKLVVDVKLQEIALHQAGIPLGPLAVELHPLDADVFLRQGRGEQGEGLGQPAVQPLPSVVLAYGKFPHEITTFRKFV